MLLLAGILPGIIFYFRITVDGAITNLEMLLSFAVFVLPVLLADLLEVVVNFTLVDGIDVLVFLIFHLFFFVLLFLVIFR